MTGLVAFDFDGTLSDDEMIVLLGERAGCAGEIEAITDRAMQGDLGYAESLRQRVALLEGLSQADVDAAFDRVALRDGASDLLRALADADVRTAIVTGGFDAGVEHALDRADAPVDRIVANRLVMDDGVLTGTVEGSLIEGTKDDALLRLSVELAVDPLDTIAIGDGANDVPMLDIAGTGIGFRPKPAVIPHCDVTVATMDRLAEVLAERGRF